MIDRSRVWPGKLATALVIVAGAASAAQASVPQAFPTDQLLVPVAVGAAFALPAIVALGFSMLMRFGRRFGAIGGVAILVLVAAAIANAWPSGLLRLAGG